MYVGFNLEIDEVFFLKAMSNRNCVWEKMQNSEFYTARFLEMFSAKGKENLKDFKDQCRQKISELFLQDNILDGSAIQEEWFNTFETDIFISHSHADEELANALAGWLNSTFGFRCFIDSNIWGYFENLIEEIVEGISPSDQERRNVAIHVHTMLQIALQEMIDKSEAVIFLNTENSMMSLEEDFGQRKYTLSPWIYHELVVTRLIAKKYPSLRTGAVTESFSLDRVPSIAYKPKTDHLLKLTPEDLFCLDDQRDTLKYSDGGLIYALYKIAQNK